jgi:hypothetical protein
MPVPLPGKRAKAMLIKQNEQEANVLLQNVKTKMKT